MSNSLVNFTSQDTGIATLTRAVPKVDASAEDSHQWDIDLVSGVDESGAEHVASSLPEVGEYLARARDGEGSAQITVKPTSRDIRLTLRFSDDELVLEDVAAEIRHIRMHLTEKAQTYVARLRLHGLCSGDSASLIHALGKPLKVTASPTQTAFDFKGVAIGSLVSATVDGSPVFGTLSSRKGKGIVIDNFGLFHTVERIDSAITLEDGWEDSAEDYRSQVNGYGGTPTWRDLVRAMAAVGNGSELNDAVVCSAVEEHLPREAGVGF